MTILNVHFEENRALIAVNSEGVRIDGTYSNNACKLFALPHANAVIAFRGQISMGLGVYLDCCSQFADLDDLFRVFPGIVGKQCTAVKAQAAAAGVRPALDAHVILIGWSGKWKQIVGLSCEFKDSLKTQILNHSILSPMEASWPAGPHAWPTTDTEMAAVARHQSRHAQAQFSGHAWRGDLHLAEITQESITFRSVREFWK